jgi:hypothetical protein
MVAIIVDPGRHISLDAGDAIALAALGFLAGIITNTIWTSGFNCWFA